MTEPLNYATPPPPRPAGARRVFWCLLPGAACLAAILTSLMIERAFPDGDSRDFGGPLIALATSPLALVFGIFAVREAFRPKGLRAFVAGAAWNAVIVVIACTCVWAIIRFGLLKSM